MRYSRRRFIAQLSMGMGSMTLLPGLSAFKRLETFLRNNNMVELPDEEKLGVALVGLGSYATGQLAPALQETRLCKLSGVVTGTPRKEDRWAKRYNIPEKKIYNYVNYEEIAENDDIDIIYIVLPNGMHADYTIQAAEAGKHVICEKPMATSVKDCQRMIHACEQHDRKLSLGYRLHFEPYNQEIMRLGREEVLGPVQEMEGSFGFSIGDDWVWRLDREMAGGGPLMDVGIYVVQASIYTMGKLPVSVTAQDKTQNTDKFDEVEGTLYWQEHFDNGTTLHGETSYESGGNRFRAETGDGFFEIGPAFSYGGLRGRTSEGPLDFPQVNQQALQMDDFARCILEDDETVVPGVMGKRDMKIIEAIYKAAETGDEIAINYDDGFIDPMQD